MQVLENSGAGEGNRTLVISLEDCWPALLGRWERRSNHCLKGASPFTPPSTRVAISTYRALHKGLHFHRPIPPGGHCEGAVGSTPAAPSYFFGVM